MIYDPAPLLVRPPSVGPACGSCTTADSGSSPGWSSCAETPNLRYASSDVAVRLVAQHCAHLGVTVDDMVAVLGWMDR